MSTTMTVPDLKVGDAVVVNRGAHTLRGVVARHQREESRFVYYDHCGLTVGVMLENGNVWQYEVSTVSLAADTAA